MWRGPSGEVPVEEGDLPRLHRHVNEPQVAVYEGARPSGGRITETRWPVQRREDRAGNVGIGEGPEPLPSPQHDLRQRVPPPLLGDHAPPREHRDPLRERTEVKLGPAPKRLVHRRRGPQQSPPGLARQESVHPDDPRLEAGRLSVARSRPRRRRRHPLRARSGFPPIGPGRLSGRCPESRDRAAGARRGRRRAGGRPRRHPGVEPESPADDPADGPGAPS